MYSTSGKKMLSFWYVNQGTCISTCGWQKVMWCLFMSMDQPEFEDLNLSEQRRDQEE